MKHLLWIVFCLPLLGQGQIIIDPTPRRPIVRPMPMPAPLQVRSLDVAVRLEGGSALTEVEQVFYNPGGRLAEGTWLFPLPAGAHVERFTMFINGVETAASCWTPKRRPPSTTASWLP